MFDIGFWEMSLIGVVALLVIGPEKLPKVVKTVGTFVGKAQRYVQKVKTDISSEFDAEDLMAMMEEQKKTIANLESSMQKNTSIITDESAKIAKSIDDNDTPDKDQKKLAKSTNKNKKKKISEISE